MGNSIEPLVVGVDALVEQAKFVGLQRGGYEERQRKKGQVMLKSPHLKPRLLRPQPLATMANAMRRR